MQNSLGVVGEEEEGAVGGRVFKLQPAPFFVFPVVDVSFLPAIPYVP